jgi:mono/diheme cytochrome c family protein
MRAVAKTLAVMLLLAVAGSAFAAEPAQLARGQAVFTHRCSMCHREGGTGTFILARRLGATKSLLEKRTDLEPNYVRTVVRWGLVNMPRISRVELPEPDMDALVAYLTAPKAPATP